MKRVICMIISVIVMIITLCVSISADAPEWIYYQDDAVPSVIPFVYKTRLNNDYTLDIVIQVKNTGDYTAENFSINKGTIKLGSCWFDISNQITGKTIKANTKKNYRVSIPYEGVPQSFTNNDLLNCEYDFEYSYATRCYWLTEHTHIITEVKKYG